MSLTILQQKLFDVLSEEIDCEAGVTEAALKEDIRSMNASELQHNIRAFSEVNETCDAIDRSIDRNQRKVARNGNACRNNLRPCTIRTASSDNTCQHYPD